MLEQSLRQGCLFQFSRVTHVNMSMVCPKTDLSLRHVFHFRKSARMRSFERRPCGMVHMYRWMELSCAIDVLMSRRRDNCTVPGFIAAPQEKFRPGS